MKVHEVPGAYSTGGEDSHKRSASFLESSSRKWWMSVSLASCCGYFDNCRLKFLETACPALLAACSKLCPIFYSVNLRSQPCLYLNANKAKIDDVVVEEQLVPEPARYRNGCSRPSIRDASPLRPAMIIPSRSLAAFRCMKTCWRRNRARSSC